MSDQEPAVDRGDEQNDEAPRPSDDDKTPRYWRTDWLASDRAQTLANVLTIIVALAAIGLSVWEGMENRRHNRLSVLPHLEPIEADMASDTPIESEHFLLPAAMDSLYAVGYSLRNSGLGPAVLEDIVVFTGEEDGLASVPSDSMSYLQAVGQDVDRLPFDAGVLRRPYAEGAMLPAGEVHHFATVIVPYSAVDSDTLDPIVTIRNEVMERHSVVFCYCSVYGEDCDMTYLGAEPPVADVCGF